MRIMQRTLAAALAVCLLCVLCACGGGKDALDARFVTLYKSEFPTEYLEDNETYASEIAGFHLKDFNGTFHEFQSFKTYSVEITIANDFDYAVDVFGLQIPEKNVGKNGVYFSTYDDGATIGVPGSRSGEQTVYYLVVAEASLSEEEVMETLGEMQISCIYADAAEAIDMYDPEADLSGLRQSVIRYSK